jgi:hypothetical protein
LALVLTALVTLAIAVPTLASAAKLPKYHVYQKCDKTGNCSLGAYFNSKHTRAITLQMSKKCSDASYVSISFSGSSKVSKKGKFKVSVDTSIYDRTTGETVRGVGTIEGKVKKKEKVTFNYSVDKGPAACAGVLSGTITGKYKGTQSGG